MEDGVQRDGARRILVEDRIWETTYHGSTILFVNGRVHLRHTTDGSDTRINAIQKLRPQTNASGFVPCKRLCEVTLNLWRND